MVATSFRHLVSRRRTRNASGCGGYPALPTITELVLTYDGQPSYTVSIWSSGTGRRSTKPNTSVIRSKRSLHEFNRLSGCIETSSVTATGQLDDQITPRTALPSVELCGNGLPVPVPVPGHSRPGMANWLIDNKLGVTCEGCLWGTPGRLLRSSRIVVIVCMTWRLRIRLALTAAHLDGTLVAVRSRSPHQKSTDAPQQGVSVSQ